MKIYPFSSSSPRRFHRGITLIEILVVIVIIAVLAGLMFPLTAKLRERGKSATCMSNVKQMGSMLILYATDRGRFPALQGLKEDGTVGDIWPLILAKNGYMWDTPNVGAPPCGKGVWTCPSCDYVSDAYGGYGIAEGEVMVYETGTAKSKRIDEIPRPSSTWLVGDVRFTEAEPKRPWYAVWPNPNQWKDHSPGVGRHGDKANICMVDGHVEALTLKEIEAKKLIFVNKQ